MQKKIHQILYKKSFNLIKNRHIRKFDELINKNKVTQSATNITDKRKWAINVSSGQLDHIETDLPRRAFTSQLFLKHFLI